MKKHILENREHPPLLHMETSDEKVREYVRQRVEPIFLKNLPQETSFDPTWVAGSGVAYKGVGSFSRFNPHNCRLYFKYSPVETGVGLGGGSRFGVPEFRNHGKEVAFTDSVSGSSVVVKKRLAEVRWRIVKWWTVDNANSEEEMRAIYADEFHKATVMFRAFVAEVGGESDFVIVKSYPLDNKLVNALSEKMPEKCLFETDVVKKLYPSKVLEYKTPEAAMRAAHAAGVIDIEPQIMKALEYIAEEIRGINPLARVKERVRVFPGDLLRPDVQALIGGLSDSEKCFLTDWLFNTFGKEYSGV